MNHDKNLVISVNNIGYEISFHDPKIMNEILLESKLNDLDSERSSECRSYGFDLSDEEIDNLHTRIFFDVKYADGTVSESHLEELGFYHVKNCDLGSIWAYDINMDKQLLVYVHDTRIKKVWCDDIEYKVQTLPNIMRLMMWIKID